MDRSVSSGDSRTWGFFSMLDPIFTLLHIVMMTRLDVLTFVIPPQVGVYLNLALISWECKKWDKVYTSSTEAIAGLWLFGSLYIFYRSYISCDLPTLRFCGFEDHLNLPFLRQLQLLLMLTTAMLSNCRQPCHSLTKKAYQGQLSLHLRSFWWQRSYPSSHTFQPLYNWHLHQSFDAKSISVLHKQITTGRFPNINSRGY